jgi:hypothetical protein
MRPAEKRIRASLRKLSDPELARVADMLAAERDRRRAADEILDRIDAEEKAAST